MKKARRGFTLAEAMVAIVFISIALFGYVSLHIRLIHSGFKLGLRQDHTGTASEKMGKALYGEYNSKEKVQSEGWTSFWEIPQADFSGLSPVIAPFPVPEDVKYYLVEETWTDRNAKQVITLDTCLTKDKYRGW